MWSVVVPVKLLAVAKSRLEVEPQARRSLALAMAMDTVRAALRATGVAEVVVVTDDAAAREPLAGLGARIVADEPDAGLNAALRHGIGAAHHDHVATLSSDLPALRPAELEDVLVVAADHRSCFVADAPGTGTTLLLAADRHSLVPAYGTDSRREHLAHGAFDITDAAGPSLRRDVDTVAELREAAILGLGADTASLVSALRLLSA
jgi:2-phospho-L-lactate guanylyltransferase